MSNNITIKFIADGDQKLIKAFKNLANAQSKFNKETKKSTSVTEQQEVAHRKLNAGMMRLRASFKAQGKSLMDAGVSAKLYKQALLGNVVAQEKVRTSVKKYNKDLADANIATRILGGSVAVLRSKMLVAAFAIGLVKQPLLEVLKAFNEMTEVTGKFNVVFGHTAEQASNFAEKLGSTFGRSVTHIKDFMASLQDTFVPLGFSRVESAKLSATLTELALDVASFNNKMDADVVRDFQSAIVGNHETVKKYGVIINEATIAQEAIRLGLIGHKNELMEFHKVQARVSLLLEGTKDAQGDVARTSHTLTNRIKDLSASFIELKESMGAAQEGGFLLLTNMGNLTIQAGKLFSALGDVSYEMNLIGNISTKDMVDGLNFVSALFEHAFKDTEGLKDAKNALEELNDEIFILAPGLDASWLSSDRLTPQVKALAAAWTDAATEIMVYSPEVLALNKLYAGTKEAQIALIDAQLLLIDNAIDEIKYSKEMVAIYDRLIEMRGRLTGQTDEEISARQRLLGVLTEEQQKKVELAQATLQIGQEVLNQFNAMTSAMSKQVNTRMNNELTALKETEKYQKASSKRKKNMEKDVTEKYAAERKRVAMFEKGSAIAGAGINTALAITKVLPNLPLAALIGALGLAQATAIAATPLPKFAAGGVVGGRRHSQGGTMIEAEQGEFVMSRNATQAIGLENLNRMNQGGGGAVNVTFTGNVMSQDFIENEAIPQIKEAIRRGADIGVS